MSLKLRCRARFELRAKIYDAKLVDFNLHFVRKSEASARGIYAATKLKGALWRRRSAICSKNKAMILAHKAQLLDGFYHALKWDFA
ncbi:hypothetical protein CGRAC_1888 [Campylobacter gracilis]|uniref:Uncharacterized protein n=1 Tax=Campylobacter gracilis RM3268 TaxID=553220 RepID=C8PHJ5_9BACT|nr:hypothetical protein CGRAC_1888 [Campylobacter gracilis]EEV17609.1 hypothetical protein CAMGR0001_0440 [Campylobacter gracilis RM3268]